MTDQFLDPVRIEDNYAKNKAFNQFLDGQADECPYEILLKDGVQEYQIPQKSLALFYGDQNKYNELYEKYKQNRLDEGLSKGDFPHLASRLEKRLYQLKQVVKNKKVILFVGAGVSASLGLPTWVGYLRQLAEQAQISPPEIETLLSEGNYVDAIEIIIEKLGIQCFESGFASDFDKDPQQSDLYQLLFDFPKIATVTTNYDKTLEVFFRTCNKPFDPVKNGAESFDNLFQSLGKGENVLLKIHGSISDQSTRILTKAEYDNHYGLNVDYNKPLPKLLTRLYGHFPFLFVGCSLSQDRLLEYFRHITSKYSVTQLPNHFAILEAPEDNNDLPERERSLADLAIQPIWYPNGQHEKLKEILELIYDNYL